MALYVIVSGTSFASPHVAGVVALLRGAVPAASAAQVEAALAATAHDLGVTGPDDDTGLGLVDAVAALERVAAPVDADGDGYPAETDCDDSDPKVHPGAREQRRDGIDQDCNGYDLTLRIAYAVYSHDGKSLRLRASSLLGARAALRIVDIGPLTWREAYHDWIYDGSADASAHARVVVRGVEGEISLRPRAPLPQRGTE
jgi:bacillopeptidase F